MTTPSRPELLGRLAECADRLADLYRAAATLEQGLIANRAQMWPQAMDDAGSVAGAERILAALTAHADSELARLRGEIRCAELEVSTVRFLIEHHPNP